MDKNPDLDHRRLDDVLHSRLRLAIVAALVPVDEMEFASLREIVGATDGNMTTHTRRLEQEGYIDVRKRFAGRKPCTSYRLTKKGRTAFAAYVEELGRFIGK
jgi:DNA-binding MarR family transcriptional regulator